MRGNMHEESRLAVVGLNSLVCKVKASQNQTSENKQGVVSGLLSEPGGLCAYQMAELVKQR